MGRPDSRGPGASARIPEIDGLRGYAILFVLTWHYVACTAKFAPGTISTCLTTLLSLCWTGVDLFFVLSGFLIGGLLMAHREATNYFRVFYVRRICRIVPLYILWVLLFYAVRVNLPGLDTHKNLGNVFAAPLPWWSYATYTQNMVTAVRGDLGPHWLGVTWSLAIEEQFYLLLPFLIKLASVRRLPFYLGALVLAAPLMRNLLPWAGPRDLARYVLLPTRMDSLLIGVLCAWLMSHEPARTSIARHGRIVKSLFALFLAGAIVMLARSSGPTDWLMGTVGYTWMALLYGCFLVLAVSRTSKTLSALCCHPWIRYLGVIAYGVYLIHQAVDYLCHSVILGGPPRITTAEGLAVTMLAVAATVAVASVSWFHFERRIVAIGHSHVYIPSPWRSADRSGIQTTEGADWRQARRNVAASTAAP